MLSLKGKEIINKLNGLRHERKYISTLTEDELNYIKLRYSDSNSLKESIYRLRNDLEEIPCCPVCGKILKFNKITQYIPKHCSLSCARKDPKSEEQRKATCIKNFGKLVNTEKYKENYLKNHGCINSFQDENVKAKIKKDRKKELVMNILLKYQIQKNIRSMEIKIK